MNAMAPVGSLIRLRRDGRPPLRFFGRQIACHDGRWPMAPRWYELGLYYRFSDTAFADSPPICPTLAGSGSDYVVAVVACTRAGPARCHASTASTLEAALDVLESHDPAHDACPGLTVTSVAFEHADLKPAVLATHLAQLQCDLHGLKRSYQIAVGSFLAKLGTYDTPDCPSELAQ